MFSEDNASAASGESWFVYLLASVDCSAFKVGFSCNPLQRIYSFHRRYFERFDLHQSLLIPVATCEQAREMEAALKTELAQFRVDAPTWVALAAGGHTEWFSAAHFNAAADGLRAGSQLHKAAVMLNAFEFLSGELAQSRLSFEHWAWQQAQLMQRIAHASTVSAAREIALSLRDWLDAYRYFGLILFEDDPEAGRFVRDCAQPHR